eukprot:gene9090-biopygen12187
MPQFLFGKHADNTVFGLLLYLRGGGSAAPAPLPPPHPNTRRPSPAPLAPGSASSCPGTCRRRPRLAWRGRDAGCGHLLAWVARAWRGHGAGMARAWPVTPGITGQARAVPAPRPHQCPATPGGNVASSGIMATVEPYRWETIVCRSVVMVFDGVTTGNQRKAMLCSGRFRRPPIIPTIPEVICIVGR